MTVGYRCCANCWNVKGLRPDDNCEHIQELIDEAVEEAVAAEREACAMTAVSMHNVPMTIADNVAREIAVLIRARKP